MSAVGQFDHQGVRFRYPTNWKLEREDSESGWTVTAQSPGTAFVTLTFDEGSPSPERMAAAALAALREVYPELEADERLDSIASQPAVGHDIRFFSLDMTNTCWTHCFYTATGTVLVLCQTSDLELAVNEPVLRAICASLEVDAE